MRWNTRIAILAGVGCVIAAVFYFRIFQPGRSYSAIAIDFQEPPADPFELVLTNRSDSGRAKSAGPKVPQRPAPLKRLVLEVPAKPKPRIYTVKSGDSLWGIAREQLGDASRHLELAELNEAALDGDLDNLKAGQKIILPPK